ncbi:MAG: hypothetical protein QM765_22235 [Myxococcales bacterium]
MDGALPPSALPPAALTLVLLLLAASCAPLVPEVDQAGAEQLLAETPPALVLDVRQSKSGNRLDRFLPGAILLAPDEVDGFLLHAKVPKDRPLLMVCFVGRTSQMAGLAARDAGYDRVFSLAGGMEAWKGATARAALQPAAEERAPRHLEASFVEQLATVALGIGIKATYMALSALLIALLWRSRERGLVRVRQSMIAFLFGEGMCAVNFLCASGESDPIEVFHGLGMLVMGSLLPWGLWQLADDRVLRYEDPDMGCAIQRFCGRCWKREAVSCGLQRLFLFVAPALAIVSLLPLCGPVVPLRIETTIFGTPMVDQVSAQLQLIEFRLYPLIACALFLVCFALLWGGKATFHGAQAALFSGLGFMSFSVMRFCLLNTFRDRILWADAWEEATEFVAIAFVLLFLFVFRRQLDVLKVLSRLTPDAAPGSPPPKPTS